MPEQNYVIENLYLTIFLKNCILLQPGWLYQCFDLTYIPAVIKLMESYIKYGTVQWEMEEVI